MSPHSLLSLLLLSFFFSISLAPASSTATAASSSPANSTTTIGINYGQVADNLPPPSAVLPLLRSLNAGHVKLYDTDPHVLSAFAGTGVEFTVGLPDRLLPRLASSPAAAASWVRSTLLPHLPATKISAVTVGNEVLTGNDSTLIRSLLPAMESLRLAVASAGLDGKVIVTTAHSLAILENSFPPSGAAFRRELVPYLGPLLRFLERANAPFLVNAYPYFAYKADPKGVDLNYVLFEPNSGVADPGSGLHYGNMLHAQVDAVRTAIKKVMMGNSTVEIRVSETGWPSHGDADEAGATPENAKRYNGNLIKLVSQGKGTPAAPAEPLRVYVFALFNENMKPGPASERHYGLFRPDMTPAYNLGIGAGQAAAPAAQSPAQLSEASTTGYMTVSSASVQMLAENLVAIAVASLMGFVLVLGC